MSEKKLDIHVILTLQMKKHFHFLIHLDRKSMHGDKFNIQVLDKESYIDIY